MPADLEQQRLEMVEGADPTELLDVSDYVASILDPSEGDAFIVTESFEGTGDADLPRDASGDF